MIASLLKRWLLSTHQGAVSEKNLQLYLDEYVFWFNRRKYHNEVYYLTVYSNVPCISPRQRMMRLFLTSPIKYLCQLYNHLKKLYLCEYNRSHLFTPFRL